MKSVDKILATLRRHANPNNVEGMARFGITATKAFGVSAPVLRDLARQIGKDHKLAGSLWKHDILEARVLAAFIDEPERVTPTQMDKWVKDFDSWAVCDGVCLHLFVKAPHAHKKAIQWSKEKSEFVRRAGFALMACLAVHDKDAADSQFKKFFPAIKRASVDERNFVKKAVNWALRQIGKRNASLNKSAILVAREIQQMNSKSARWIAADALRELTGNAVRKRIKRNQSFR